MTNVEPNSVIRPGEAVSAEALNRLIAEHAELQGIVRGLAASAPVMQAGWDEAYEACAHCDVGSLDAGVTPAMHQPDCPYFQALEWVAAHPCVQP